MPTPTTKRLSGRPTPITSSRAGPPPSGSLGMVPMDCSISIRSGTAIARMTTITAQPARLGAVRRGSSIKDGGAAPTTGSHRAQAAPRTTSKTATGKPNRMTRPHAASRIEAAAIGTGENKTRPWLAEIASASAIGAAPCFCDAPPSIGRSSGISKAKAVAGKAPMPATRPNNAAIVVRPNHRQWLIAVAI